MDLEEACEAEHYLDLAHRCTSAMDDLADVTSPESRRAMLTNTFTPRPLDTNFTIPKAIPGSTNKGSAAQAWSPRNFPPTLREASYNSQVKITIIDTESTM